MKCINRPAKIVDGHDALNAEFSSARWTHHRLLEIEDAHQNLLDATAEECAPGIVRVGRLIMRLSPRRRDRLKLAQRPELLAALRAKYDELRATRNADDDWKSALRWLDEIPDDAPDRGAARRRAGETDEQFAERTAKRRTKLTRREHERSKLYAKRQVHWSTWNGLIKQVDQARASVLKQRKAGLPGEWKHPRFLDPVTLYADGDGKNFRVIERGNPWWTIEMRVLSGWVRIRTKFGNWHRLDGSEKLVELKLTRHPKGRGFEYSASLTVKIDQDLSQFATRGTVALDWGHREHGHESAHLGIRAFSWVGDDGSRGEILIPRECRELLDRIASEQSRLDEAFNARRSALKIPERFERQYRKRLILCGVRTEEEERWLRWVTKIERRIDAARERVTSLRNEAYIKAARMLRRNYATFVFEKDNIPKLKKAQADESMPRRKRQNRDLAAKYLFEQLIERLGGEKKFVSARNTTRECRMCGDLHENTAELVVVCPNTGLSYDKDFGAALTILRRGQGALANHAAQ